MPNRELLLNNIAQIIETKGKDPTLFATFDLWCAYSQILLDTETKINVILFNWKTYHRSISFPNGILWAHIYECLIQKSDRPHVAKCKNLIV